MSDFVVITGCSGAGRSQAANELEDLGWFVIDNLPVELIPKVVELVAAPGSTTERVALATYQARGKDYLVLLRPYEQGLLMQQLRYQDELRDPKGLDLPAEGKSAGITAKEIALAKRIEITRAESGLAARLEDILVAETLVRRRERDLKRVMNRPDLPMWRLLESSRT